MDINTAGRTSQISRQGILVLALGIFACALASEPERIGIVRFQNSTGLAEFNHFHLLLREKFEYEVLPANMGVISINAQWAPRIKDQLRVEKHCLLAVAGNIVPGADSSRIALTFVVWNLETGAQSRETVNLEQMGAEDAAEVVVLKIKSYLDRSFLSKLSVSSIPLGCNIVLDGARSGKTPKEFILKAGTYELQITGPYFAPYSKTVQISPGNSLALDATMKFQGYPTEAFFISSVGFTLLTIATWVYEEKLHHDYMAVPEWSSQEEFDNKFSSFKRAQYARIGLLNVSILGWFGTGFCHFSNRTIQKHTLPGK